MNIANIALTARKLAAGLLALTVLAGTAAAQQASPLPSFREPGARAAKPDLGARRVLRFLTSSDWPPFQFVTPDGTPAGFHVDLARAICNELQLACTLQAWEWNELTNQLNAGKADAVIAGLRPSADLRSKVDLSSVYLRIPARFAARKDRLTGETTPETLAGRTVAVQQGTAHEAFLRAFFPAATARPFANAEEARAAVKKGEVDAIFADAVSLSLWLSGASSEECCAFAGGPYLESRYFGEGLAIAVRAGDTRLQAAIDYALGELDSKGTLAELYLRWFPAGLY